MAVVKSGRVVSHLIPKEAVPQSFSGRSPWCGRTSCNAAKPWGRDATLELYCRYLVCDFHSTLLTNWNV